MKLLLADGTNIVMRCAFGGDIQPPEAIVSATTMIERAAREVGATHMIIALDYPGVIGVSLLITLIYLIANLLIDLAYPLADPRMRARA